MQVSMHLYPLWEEWEKQIHSWVFWWPAVCWFFFFARSPRERGRSETLHGTFFQVIRELQEWLVLVSAWEVWVFNRKEAWKILHVGGRYKSMKLTVVMNFSVEEVHCAHSLAVLVFSSTGTFCTLLKWTECQGALESLFICFSGPCLMKEEEQNNASSQWKQRIIFPV